MLISQAGIQMPMAQLQIVFCKSGNIIFLHLCVRLWYDILLIVVMPLTFCTCCLRTATQFTFPDWIGQHQFTCRHPTVLIGQSGDGAVAVLFARLQLVVIILRFLSQHGGVQVNAKFAGLTYIVAVQFPYGSVLFADIRCQTYVAIKGSVLQIVLLHIRLEGSIKELLRRET